MKYFILLFAMVLISGCEKPQITELDKKLLPTADDLTAIGCKYAKPSDLAYETSGLAYLIKEVTVTYKGSERCHFYFSMEVTDYKLRMMGGNSARSSLVGAKIGLKVSGIESREPKEKHQGLRGDYYEAYEESGDYQGFVYASEHGAIAILAFTLGIEKEHQAVLLELVKTVETRILNKDMIKAKENMSPETIQTNVVKDYVGKK